jgi:mRNA-degrading endonuclease RelE of RelBE toxin-antitoxin system
MLAGAALVRLASHVRKLAKQPCQRTSLLVGDAHRGRRYPRNRRAPKAALGHVGRGKRGGARVIYYLQTSADRIYLVYGYVKAKQEDLTPQQLKVLAALMKEVGDG